MLSSQASYFVLIFYERILYLWYLYLELQIDYLHHYHLYRITSDSKNELLDLKTIFRKDPISIPIKIFSHSTHLYFPKATLFILFIRTYLSIIARSHNNSVIFLLLILFPIFLSVYLNFDS